MEAGRTEQGHTFLNPSEKEKLIRDAARMGMTQSAYLRHLVVSQSESAETAVLDEAVVSASRPEGEA